MNLLRWESINGRKYIINPNYIVCICTKSEAGKVSQIHFINGEIMEIFSNKIPDFTKDWYACLNFTKEEK